MKTLLWSLCFSLSHVLGSLSAFADTPLLLQALFGQPADTSPQPQVQPSPAQKRSKKPVPRQARELRDGDSVPRNYGDGNDVSSTKYVYAPTNKLTLHCNFDRLWDSSSYIRFDADRRRAWVASGWPIVWQRIQNVKLKRGSSKTNVPFGDEALILVDGGRRPIMVLHASATNHYQSRSNTYEIEAAWGMLPGMEIGQHGTCKTDVPPELLARFLSSGR